MNNLVCELKFLPAPVIFREIYKFKKSGILIFNLKNIQKTMFFKEGKIVLAQSNLDNEKIGNELLKYGYISNKELHDCLNEKKDKTLGELLISNGLISENRFRECILSLQQKIIFSIFNWNRGTFQFIEQANSFTRQINFIMPNLSQLIIRGIYQIADYRKITEYFPKEETIFISSKEAIFPAKELILRGKDIAILELMKEPLTIDDIQKQTNFPLEFILKSLFILYSVGLIEKKFNNSILNKERKQIIDYYYFTKKSTYYEILGIKENSNLLEIGLSYIKLYQKFYSLLMKPEYIDLIFYIEGIIKNLNEAYKILRYSLSRRAYDEIIKNRNKKEGANYNFNEDLKKVKIASLATKQKAYQFYQLANEAGIRNDREGKIFFLRKACELDSNNAFYLFNLGYILSFELGKLKEGEKLFLDSIKIEPNNSECWFYLSQLYKNLGLPYKSEAALNEAIRLDGSYEKYSKEKDKQYLSPKEFKEKLKYLIMALIFLMLIQIIFIKDDAPAKPPFLINKKEIKRY